MTPQSLVYKKKYFRQLRKKKSIKVKKEYLAEIVHHNRDKMIAFVFDEVMYSEPRPFT